MNTEIIQEYIDKQAIQEVLARYSICVDTGDTAGFAALFTEDALWEWEGADLLFCGRKSLKQIAEAVATHAIGGQHAISNTVITNIDGNQAQSICQLSCFLSKPEQIYSVMLGFYEDELTKVDEKWLISHRRVRIANPEILEQGKLGEYFAPLGVALAQIKMASPHG